MNKLNHSGAILSIQRGEDAAREETNAQECRDSVVFSVSCREPIFTLSLKTAKDHLLMFVLLLFFSIQLVDEC